MINIYIYVKKIKLIVFKIIYQKLSKNIIISKLFYSFKKIKILLSKKISY